VTIVGGNWPECLGQYFKDQNPAVRKNLEFFIALRNKIEHRSLPELDPEIFGECQAMLMNFESILCSQFGDRYAIRGGLSFALQFSRSAPKFHTSQAKSYSAIKAFVEKFRSSLDSEIQSNLSYSFKVFLVPKIGAHASKDSVAVEFVKYDPSKPEEMKQYERVVALIKPKHIQVANLGLLKATDAAKRIALALGRPFNLHHHRICYRHFNVRPPTNAPDPAACDTRYCIYDSLHRDYAYTEEWIGHLIKTLSDTATYDFLFAKKTALPKTTSGQEPAA
jgi:Domain of unknown function (DUF3644)